MKRTLLKKLMVIGILLGIGTSIVLFLYSIGALPVIWPTKPFSSEQWKAAPPGERYVLCHDLLNRKLLEGLTKQEVMTLLGPPDSDLVLLSGPPDDKAFSGSYMTYIVKYAKPGDPGLNVIYLLDIRFDVNDRVTEYLLRGD